MRSLLLVAAGLLAAAALLAAPTRSPASTPPTVEDGSVARGAALYVASCASCHGSEGRGTEYAPAIAGVGEAAADLQLRTGRMPAADAQGPQPLAKPPAFDEQAIRDLIAYVGSLGEGPAIPSVSLDDALLPRGQELYIANCAPCHGSTASGGAVGGGALAPSLHRSEPLIVAEAMVVGPGQMPVFAYDERDRNAVVTYVEFIRTGPNPGGFSIGNIGPVPEGFVGWVLGMGALLLIVMAVSHEWRRRDVSHPEETG